MRSYCTNGKAMGGAPSENDCCPRFIAYTHEDSFVEADDSLNELIRLVLSDGVDEDIVIWEDTERIAAVIVDGRVTRFKRKVKA